MSRCTDEPGDSLVALMVFNFPKQHIVTSFGCLCTLHFVVLQYDKAEVKFINFPCSAEKHIHVLLKGKYHQQKVKFFFFFFFY